MSIIFQKADEPFEGIDITIGIDTERPKLAVDVKLSVPVNELEIVFVILH